MSLKEKLLRKVGLHDEPKKETGAFAIRVERDSVCMGDDCNAPNAMDVPCREGEKLSEFMGTLAASLPKMRSSVWAVKCKGNVIGFIDTNRFSRCETTICINDIQISSLASEKLFCKYYTEGRMANKYPECETLLEKVRKELGK